MIDERIDVAVHSLKDLPTDPVEGLILAAIPPREEVADVLVSHDRVSLDQLPKGARRGNGKFAAAERSCRYARPDLVVEDIRGNVDTRLRKLADGQYDAIVLAAAGLRRLGRASEITQVLPCEIMLPAVGQGALGIETRTSDDDARAVLAALDDATNARGGRGRAGDAGTTARRVPGPGGRLVPFGCGGRNRADWRGSERRRARKLLREERPRPGEAAALGVRVADALLAAGAAALIDQSRQA